MKKRAIIYYRVSTDEQANGYSLREQKDRLEKHCQLKEIEIAAIYCDDFSATTIERPEFRKLRAYAKQHKNTIDYILIVKWDRFSRVASDAHFLINEFNKLNIEVQAIEQPLDFSIPESILMLAIYVAVPQVDNHRRALNVTAGTRRAKLEGRWLGPAAIGYKCSRDERNKPIKIFSDTAPLIIEAFNLYAKGVHSQEEVRQMIVKRGLNISKTRFNVILKSPIYIGKIFIPAYKDQPAHYVKGLHQPLIEEAVFYKVQQILSGREVVKPKHNSTQRDELPLRRLLICSECGNSMTGSASKGRNARYFYYHCQPGCKNRFRAEIANSAIVELLSNLKPDKAVQKLYAAVMKEIFLRNNQLNKTDEGKINQEITKTEKRIEQIQNLLADGELEPADYKLMKINFDKILTDLSSKKSTVAIETDYSQYLKSGINFLAEIDKYYDKASTTGKQQIIGSIFSEKLVFDKNKYRTTKLNEAVSLIYLTNKELEHKKTGQNQVFFDLSHFVLGAVVKTPLLFNVS